VCVAGPALDGVLDALVVLTKASSEGETPNVVEVGEAGAVPALTALLSASPSAAVRAAHVVANIALDQANRRRLVQVRLAPVSCRRMYPWPTVMKLPLPSSSE